MLLLLCPALRPAGGRGTGVRLMSQSWTRKKGTRVGGSLLNINILTPQTHTSDEDETLK